MEFLFLNLSAVSVVPKVVENGENTELHCDYLVSLLGENKIFLSFDT